MSTVIILVWLGFLVLLVKLNILKRWYLWMKISPVVIWALCQIFLFVPMGFIAPSGRGIVLKDSVQIAPGVAGMVTDVPIKSGVLLKKGDVLFQIDKTVYQANVDKLMAELLLARQARDRQKNIQSTNHGATTKALIEQVEAQYTVIEAKLKVANEALKQTTVRAPFDGIVTNIILRPGAILSSTSQVMSFVEASDNHIDVPIDQINLRHIKPGQQAEVIFKFYPGKIYEASVREVIQANSSGVLEPGGVAPKADDIDPEPFWVVLNLKDETIAMPAGAVGTVAIYTNTSSPSALFRKIVLRMENWLNFIVPN
jgi:multidrug resistance efflux pump